MRPINVLELRSVRGTGGGPEKTILLGAARTDRSRYAVTVCYIRDTRDGVFAIDVKAANLPVDYVEILERHSFDTGVWPALRRIVRERSIDIVHAHEYKTDLLAWLLHRFEGVIPLSTAHGWTGHSLRERFLYYPIGRMVLRGFPKVIAVSDDIRNRLIRSGVRPATVQTILNGIDHTAFRRDPSQRDRIRAGLGLEPEDIAIGSVGRLEPQKRFDLLIDSLARMRADRPRLRLLVVGDGSLRETLDAQIDRLGLRGVCQLLGHRGDIAAMHHAFDLFVQSSDYEGTPNAVLEAMALETPIVATDVGGTAQLVRHGVDGLIIPSGNLDVLCAAIVSALSDGAGMAARVASARQRVETDLSFESRMATVEAVYTELYAERRPRSTGAIPART